MIDANTIKAQLWQRDTGEGKFTTEAACVAATVAIMLLRITKYEAAVILDGYTVRENGREGAMKYF